MLTLWFIHSESSVECMCLVPHKCKVGTECDFTFTLLVRFMSHYYYYIFVFLCVCLEIRRYRKTKKRSQLQRFFFSVGCVTTHTRYTLVLFSLQVRCSTYLLLGQYYTRAPSKFWIHVNICWLFYLQTCHALCINFANNTFTHTYTALTTLAPCFRRIRERVAMRWYALPIVVRTRLCRVCALRTIIAEMFSLACRTSSVLHYKNVKTTWMRQSSVQISTWGNCGDVKIETEMCRIGSDTIRCRWALPMGRVKSFRAIGKMKTFFTFCSQYRVSTSTGWFIQQGGENITFSATNWKTNLVWDKPE